MTACASAPPATDGLDAAAAYDAGVADGLESSVPPALPPDCRALEPLTVKAGDRLDAAALKLNAARKAANSRVRRCATFYDAMREERVARAREARS